MNTKTISRLHIFLAGLLLAVPGVSSAQDPDPSWGNPLWQSWHPSDPPVINTAAPESVVAASAAVPQPAAPSRSVLSMGATTSATPNPAASATEIVALAAALGNDPVRIYNHVRNHIEYACYRGLRKGAVLTLLEGSGNDCDQSALLIALLNAANFTDTSYVTGTEALNYAAPAGEDVRNMCDWLGLPAAPYPNKTFLQAFGWPVPPVFSGMTDAQAKQLQFCASFRHGFGLPVLTVFSENFLGIDRVWVQVVVGGTTYQLDPAYKRYEDIQGLDPTALSGYNRPASVYNRAALLGGVHTTASTADYYQGLNDTDVRAALGQLTANVLASLRGTQYAGCSTEQIISGRRIVPREISDLADADQPVWTWGTPSSSADLPGTEKSAVKIEFGGTTYTVNTADLGGGRLSLTFEKGTGSAPDNAVLWLDDTVQARAAVSPADSQSALPYVTLRISVIHPGFLPDAFVTTAKYLDGKDKNNNGFVYVLLHAFDASGRMVQQRYEKLKAYRDGGLGDNSREVRSESLNIIGLNWLYQTQLVERACAACGGVTVANQHRVGRMAQEKGTYIDVSNQCTITMSRTGDAAAEETYFQMPSLVWSAMEHGVIEQLQPGTSAVSTVNILRAANTANQKIYLANASNWATVRSFLNYYPAGAITQLSSYLVSSTANAATFSTDNRTLLPANGNVTQGVWTGTGYVIRAPGPGLAGMIINGGYQGGYCDSDWVVESSPISDYFAASPVSAYSSPDIPASMYEAPTSYFTSPPVTASDPVDMSTGAFTLASDDMSTGVESAPRGLRFSHSYTSLHHLNDDQCLGKGWTHNLDMRAMVRTAVEESAGLGTPAQCAPLLAAIPVMCDLYRTDATPKEFGIAVHTAGWLVDMMTNGAVSIHIGPQTFQFVKMPDGSYSSPAGSTATLTQTGTTYQLKERLGNTIAFDAYNRASSITDPDGMVMTFSYNGTAADSTIDSVQDAYYNYYLWGYWGRIYNFGYDSTGTHITSVTEYLPAGNFQRVAGHIIYFGYDANWNLVSATDPIGNTTNYDYAITGDPPAQAALSYIRRVRDRTGSTVVESDYDTLGRVCKQRSQGAPTKETTFHYSGFQTDEINPAGGVTSYLFDDRGRSSGTIAPDRTTNSWIYDGQDQVVQSTDGAGRTTHYQYDTNLNLKEIDYPEGGRYSVFHYDTLNRPTDTIDPDGRTVTRQYDTGNTGKRPDHIKVADGTADAGTTDYTYNTSGPAVGRIHTVTDPDGLATTYTYDTFGQPASVAKPGSLQTYYTLSERGDVTDITDPKGVITHVTYNNRRQPVTVIHDYTGANEATEDLTYDNEGRPQTHTAPPDNDGQRFAATIAYSATGKPLKTTYTGDTTTAPYEETTYDKRDWQDHSYDIARRQTDYTPTSAGLLQGKTLPLGRALSQTQDGIGRVTSLTAPGAPGNRVKGYSYGISGTGDQTSGYPKTTLTTADTLTSTTELNHSGQPRYTKDRRGHVWEFRYDNAGRPTHVIRPTDATAGRAWITQYTSAGRVHLVTAPSGNATSYTYNTSTGRPATAADGVGTTTFTGYDNNGNLLALSETRGGQAYAIGKTYDRLNRPATRTDESGATVGYVYYPSGKLQLLVYPGGTASTKDKCVEYTYWKSGRLKQVIDHLTTGTTRTTSYTWNPDGRLAGIVRPNNTRRDIQYDGAGRPWMITESALSGAKLIHLQKLTYYPSDEVATRYVIPPFGGGKPTPAPSLSGLTFDASNQLDTFPGRTVSYDLDGNMTVGPLPNGAQGSFNFDARNRLTGAGGTTVTYDAEGMRKTVTEGGTTTSYVMDASGAGKVLQRTKGTATTKYVWGVGLCYEVDSSGNTTTYHYDATGSTIALTNDSAKTIERVEYSPYGLVTRRWNAAVAYHDTPFLYTGMLGNETDANGLVHMRARYYHPLLGRFINGDPARSGSNWYAYANGNPLGYVDPSGLCAESAMDVVQGVLSFVGLVPGVGVAAEVVNTAISLGRGNYDAAESHMDSALTNAAFSLAGAGVGAIGARIESGMASTAFRAESSMANLESRVVTEGGGDILENSYRLGTPSTRADASALNRFNFDRAAPEIVRQRSTQLFSEVSGNPINGYYNQATNQIFLGKGSNLGTLTEELIHAGQRLDYGGRIPPNMINLMEQQAARKLDKLGFELSDP
jgi:RHS repeat-associated protein